MLRLGSSPQSPPNKIRRQASNSASYAAALITLLLAAACQQSTPPDTAPLLPKVVVAQPQARDVVDWDEYIGRLQAVESVEIRAQVSGSLRSIEFEDGAMVRKGDLLFTLDPRAYEASLNRSNAEVELATARLELARRELARAEQLLKQRSISQEEYDARFASVRQADASVAAAKAAVQAAALNVEFTRVVAPISGRVGRHLVSVGNLVNGGATNSTILTTIVSLDPIFCYFETDERSYLKYVRLAQSGVRPSSPEAKNVVQIGLADEDGFPHQGWMDFIDNQLDANTGTMSGRAVLNNPDMLLTPGLFVRLRLIGSGTYHALLLPDEAVGTDQAQKFVWIIDEHNKVQRRRVNTGPLYEGLRIVRDGIQPTDRVIVVGMQRVHPGTEVRIDDAAARPSPSAAVADTHATSE